MRGLSRSAGPLIVAAWLAASCTSPGTGPSSDAALCEARGALVAAAAESEMAVAAAEGGDKEQAHSHGDTAFARAEAAHELLLRFPDQAKKSERWQVLLDVYLHLGQAANAVRRGPYEEVYSPTLGRRELNVAKATLDRFAVPVCSPP